jgi:hypothetical protein
MKVLCLAMLILPIWGKSNTVQKFSELYKAGRVNIKINATGGHVDRCVNVRLTNNTNKPITLYLEPGLVFDSEDNNLQNLITTQTEQFVLLPGKSETRLVNAFCMQAHHLTPVSGANYSYSGFADSNLLKVCSFIDVNDINGELAQQAIWVISDKNELESISAGTPELKEKVIQFLVQNFKLKKRGNYEIIYRYLPNVAFSGQILKIKGKINYELSQGAFNSLLIQDDRGRTYIIIAYRVFEKCGKHERNYEFYTKNLPKGVYYARLYSNQKIIAEQEIDLS